jgi:TIR domain
MPASLFISYSHRDSSLVRPIVGVLRGTAELVFHDASTIRPGSNWEQSIRNAIMGADIVVLFWCDHSSRSSEVRKEYEFALSSFKNVMPLLLDSTPLPENLSQFQWVDFRQLAAPNHRPPSRAHRLLNTLFWATLTSLVAFLVWSSLAYQPGDDASPGGIPRMPDSSSPPIRPDRGPPPLPEIAPRSSPDADRDGSPPPFRFPRLFIEPLIVAASIVAFAIAVVAYNRYRRSRKLKKPAAEMATVLARELSKRGVIRNFKPG